MEEGEKIEYIGGKFNRIGSWDSDLTMRVLSFLLNWQSKKQTIIGTSMQNTESKKW